MRWLNRPVMGWITYDFANSAFATTVLAVIFNRYYAEIVAGGQNGTSFAFGELNFQIPGATMWSLVVSFSTAIVAISSPLLGAVADLAIWRKRLFLIYCYFGVFCTCGLYFVYAGDIFLGSLLFVCANLGFAGGNVFYNSFLVDIGNHNTYGRISGFAWGVGYLGGGLCLGLNLIMLQKPELLGFNPGTFDINDCLLISGIWWGLFAIPTMLWVKEKRDIPKRIPFRNLVINGFKRNLNTLREVRKFRQLARFLLAYLLFNDGIETIIVMASIFGAEVVGLSTSELIVYFLIIQGTALIGAFMFGWLTDYLTNKSTLLITLAVWIIVVLWAFRLGWFIDLRTDYYIIGMLAGLVMGGSQSVARSMQAALTPKSRSTEFFGFFAISGKFSSVFGPLIYGLAIWLAGGIQTAILSLGVFFVSGAVMLILVNEREGIQIALNESEIY